MKKKRKKHIITVTLHTSSNELYNCNHMVLPRTEKIFLKLLSALFSNGVQI